MLQFTNLTRRVPRSSNVECKPDLPQISSRWEPGSLLRRDTAAGTFEHVNPRDFSNDALYLQQALILDGEFHKNKKPQQHFSLAGASPVIWLAFVLAALGYFVWRGWL